MTLNEVSPRLLAIGEEPLITQGYDTVIAGSRHDFSLRLVVSAGETSVNHLLLDDWLGILDLETRSLAHKHDALVETLEVNLVLGLS